MISRFFWLIYVQPLRRVVLAAAALVLLWGIMGSLGAGKKWWRALNAAALLCGVGAILYLTVSSREGGVHEVVLRPFMSFVAAKEEPELYRSMLMNIFLFVPMGLSLPNLLPKNWHPAGRLAGAVLMGFCLSAAVELCQYRFWLGRCETDDVIMNTLGTLAGGLSYILSIILHRTHTSCSK